MLSRLHQQIYTRRVPRYMIIEESPSVKRARRRRAYWTTGLVTLVLSLLLGVTVVNAQQLPQTKAEVDTPQTATLNELGGGALLFRTEQHGAYTPAVTQSTKANMNINGMLARVTVKQRFKNHTDRWQEAVYAFPLPDQAGVDSMRIVIGDREIEGVIKERQKARKVFEKAKATGKKASLVEQQRPNMFTNAIANIGPGEQVDVEISYLQSVSYEHGRFSVRFPMTITPRYIPGNALNNSDIETAVFATGQHGWADATSQVADAQFITPQQRPDGQHTPGENTISIEGRIDLGMPMQAINSAYHQMALQRSEHHYRFSLSEGEVAMNQDFVLTWQPLVGSEPEAAVFSETFEGDTYALLMVVPPYFSANEASTLTNMPKEQIFIIDTSGSMGGVSIEQARASLHVALDRLNPRDAFNIIEFNSVTRSFSPQPVLASPSNLAQARRMVDSLQADGGTEMLPALKRAMTQVSAKDDTVVSQIVFITDGAVGNEQALFSSIANHLNDRRLFTVGIGSAPNSHFMRKASQFGRGSFTHIGDVSEVQEKMDALLSKLERPVITDLHIDWPVSAATEDYPAALPDLYNGEPLMLSTRLEGELPTGSELTASIRGRSADQLWRRELLIMGNDRESPGVATLWARRKIESLLDSKSLGATEQTIRPKVLKVALAHKLMSPYTSFVAVEKRRSRPRHDALDSSAVPNARPKGQVPQIFAYPQGSTEARISFVWAALLLITALVFRAAVRQEQRYVLRA
ncbi:MAG: marine proteobacterial sortase target protein [Pseudomonadota bacterium]